MANIPPNPIRNRLRTRLGKGPDSREQGFHGTVYRFINPAHSTPKEIVNGKGGYYAHGRWNLAGAFPVTYASLDPETALAEALAQVRYYRLPVRNALPRTLVSIQVRLSRTLDLTDGNLRRQLILGQKTMRQLDWRRENQDRREALTQAWGWVLQDAGLEGIQAPSAANPQGVNLIVFPENLLSRSRFSPTPAR